MGKKRGNKEERSERKRDCFTANMLFTPSTEGRSTSREVKESVKN